MKETKYKSGDIVGPYTLIENLKTKSKNYKWKCKCNLCGSIVEVFSSNLTKQKMCKFCRTNNAKHARKDISGQRRGRAVIVKYEGNSKWLCVCDCGNYFIATTAHLNSGHTQSCGCYMREQTSKANITDLSGKKFGKLSVKHRVEDYISRKGKKCIQYCCLCDCGTEINVLATNLLNGNTKSCGCIGASFGEYYITTELNKYNIRFEKEYSFSDLKSPKGNLLRFDFALFNLDNSLNCLIEFNGEQHYYNKERKTNFGKFTREISDPIKELYCMNNNIILYKIKFNDDIDERLKEIIDKYLHANPVPSV